MKFCEFVASGTNKYLNWAFSDMFKCKQSELLANNCLVCEIWTLHKQNLEMRVKRYLKAERYLWVSKAGSLIFSYHIKFNTGHRKTAIKVWIVPLLAVAASESWWRHCSIVNWSGKSKMKIYVMLFLP